jgi:hypothetical protein
MLVLICLSRLIPHPFNFSPIGSIFLMSPMFFDKKKWSLFISFVPLVISDILIGKFVYNSNNLLYDGFYWVYISYFMIWLYSIKSSQNIISKSVFGSLIFFFVTNLGCWLNNPIYPQNFYGVLESYIAGIPFYWNTLLGFIFYSGILFFGKILTNKVVNSPV